MPDQTIPTVTDEDRAMARLWWQDYQGGPPNYRGPPYPAHSIYGAPRHASFDEQLAYLVAAAREKAADRADVTPGTTCRA